MNSIGNTGIRQIASCISTTKSLVVLNLASNDISNEGMGIIFEAMKNN
jgi:hypothetical protein